MRVMELRTNSGDSSLRSELAVLLVSQEPRDVKWLARASAAGLVKETGLFDGFTACRIVYPDDVISKRGEAAKAM